MKNKRFLNRNKYNAFSPTDTNRLSRKERRRRRRRDKLRHGQTIDKPDENGLDENQLNLPTVENTS